MAGRFLSLIRTVDAWLIARTENVLLFLNEWLSISQRKVEISLIVITATLRTIYDCHHHYGWLPNDAIITAFMVICMLQPSATRAIYRVDYFWIIFRPNGLMFAVWMIIQGTIARVSIIDRCVGLEFLFYTLFWCCLACSQDGERGRKRKAALAKIKELFGTDWMPDPVKVPS